MKQRTRLLALLSTLFLASCASSGRSPVRGDDDTSFLALRGDFAFGRRTESGRSQHGVVIAHERTDGDFEQSIGTGQALELDDLVFNGPTTVRVDYEVRRTNVQYRYAIDAGPNVRVAPFGGIGAEVVELRLSNGAVAESETYRAIGPRGGVRVEWAPLEELTLFGEYEAQESLGSHLSEASTRAWSVGIELHPVPWFGLVVGYRDLELEYEVDSGTRSDVDLELSGVIVALEFSN